jgi:hypothetical protein
MKLCTCALLMTLTFTASAFATVTVSNPWNGDTVGSPAQFVATASSTTCSRGVASMGVYVDNSLQYVVTGSSLNISIAISPGNHQAVIEEWDNCGGATFTPENIIVTQQSGVYLTSPANNSTVSPTVTFAATATTSTCPQGVASMGVYVNNQLVHVQNGSKLNTQVTLASGAQHTVTQEWDYCGGSTYATSNITVTGSSGGASGPVIPSSAVSFANLQNNGNWQQAHDDATGGSANGYMTMVGSPSRSGHAREFVTSYSNSAAERYGISFDNNATSTNFVYDTWVYLNSSSSVIANMEMDLNQVMPNGQTVIMGFQCDGYSSTWDYTANIGTATKPVDHWIQSKAACNVRKWSTYTWHHVQVLYSHDESGVVTYKSVWLDGVEQDINATVSSAFALGWAPTLLTNFQVDGLGASGTSTIIMDNLNVYRW